MESDPQPRRLYRSREQRMVAGVCGGIAEYFGWDVTVVRLAFVLSIFLPGTQVIVYLLAWLIVPEAPWRSAPAPGYGPPPQGYGQSAPPQQGQAPPSQGRPEQGQPSPRAAEPPPPPSQQSTGGTSTDSPSTG